MLFSLFHLDLYLIQWTGIAGADPGGGGGVPGGQGPPFSPKLHKEGKNAAPVGAKTPAFRNPVSALE